MGGYLVVAKRIREQDPWQIVWRLPFHKALVGGPHVTPSCRAEAHRGVLRKVQVTHVPPLLLGVDVEEEVEEAMPELGAWAGAQLYLIHT